MRARRLGYVLLAVCLVGCGQQRKLGTHYTTRMMTVHPLPLAGNYTAKRPHNCIRDRSECQAIQLVPVSAAAKSLRYPVGAPRQEQVPIKVTVTKNGASEQPSYPLLEPSEGAYGLTAKQLDKAYGVPESLTTKEREEQESQTIAIVDTGEDPWAESTLNRYSRAMGIPECTAASGCFSEVQLNGATIKPPRSATEAYEALRGRGSLKLREQAVTDKSSITEAEEYLDIEIAHAMCWYCKIKLVMTNSPGNFPTVPNKEAGLGATITSTSWSEGGTEKEYFNTTLAKTKEKAEEAAAGLNTPGVANFAANGDGAYEDLARIENPFTAPNGLYEGGPIWPAAMRGVIAVGGTYLELEPSGTRKREIVWDEGNVRGTPRVVGTGGGCATTTAPSWQTSYVSALGCEGRRSSADVAANGATLSSFAELTTFGGWGPVAGTSESAPLVAGMFGAAGGAHGVANPIETIYSKFASTPADFYDVKIGTNGLCAPRSEAVEGCLNETTAAEYCKKEPICLSRTGYDGPSGTGVPTIAGLKP